MADPFMQAWRIPLYASYDLQPVQEVCINLSDITQESAEEFNKVLSGEYLVR